MQPDDPRASSRLVATSTTTPRLRNHRSLDDRFGGRWFMGAGELTGVGGRLVAAPGASLYSRLCRR